MKILRTLAFLGTAALMLSATAAMADAFTLDFENNTSVTINTIYLDIDPDPGNIETGDSVLLEGPVASGGTSILDFDDTDDTEACAVDLVVATSNEYIPLEDVNVCPEDGLISLTDEDLGLGDDDVAEDEEDVGGDCNVSQSVHVINETSSPIGELFAFYEISPDVALDSWYSSDDIGLGDSVSIHPTSDTWDTEAYTLEAYTSDSQSYASVDIDLCDTDITWTITDDDLMEAVDH